MVLNRLGDHRKEVAFLLHLGLLATHGNLKRIDPDGVQWFLRCSPSAEQAQHQQQLNHV